MRANSTTNLQPIELGDMVDVAKMTHNAMTTTRPKPKVNLETKPEDRPFIMKIATRALKMGAKQKIAGSWLDWAMDVTSVHVNACSLDLKALSEATNMDFTHDMVGIRKNLNRETGVLTNSFVPRFRANKAYSHHEATLKLKGKKHVTGS